ncbi:MAG: type II toxin-antitoxin system RelE/ParE family toxin [Chitinophagales bacterium]|nr:type II toxin-antitoxin system RelE/ParE family toxin [Chitinophagales bacterium]
MEKKIKWRKKAKARLQEIYNFLYKKWGEKATEDFLDLLERDLELLLIFPNMGILSEEKPLIRKFLVTKHNYLIYTIRKGYLIVLNIQDTRMQ